MLNRSEDNFLISYDCRSGMFCYSPLFTKQFAAKFDERPLWQIMTEDGLTTQETAQQFHSIIKETREKSIAGVPQVRFEDFCFQCEGQKWKWYRVGVIASVPCVTISITFTDIDEEVRKKERMEKLAEYDELTGLLKRNAFCRRVDAVVESNPEEIAAGGYAMIYFDVQRFKVINDMFGMAEGDRLLSYIGDSLRRAVGPEDLACRIGSDRFAFFVRASKEELEGVLEQLFADFSGYKLLYEVICNMGIYMTASDCGNAVAMINRAVLAQESIKGSYTDRCNFFTENMRDELVGEQEIAGIMATALEEKQFVVYYQPQYNHTTETLVGVEALVRWNHPERGLISPGVFVPIFEKNGSITKLDLYVFETVCSFLKECIETEISVVPVSVNFSRCDISQPDFADNLENIRRKYDVPVKYLRVEITESAIVGGSRSVNEAVKNLRSYGYVVEMDDFGSGYSSLNALRELELDMIKLDMMFLAGKSEGARGGTIISSIVRMAKWLELPVIAEGVETASQADFLRSIGCDYIQGYLYSEPLPQEEYVKVLSDGAVRKGMADKNLIDTVNAGAFWEVKSLETLIFSNYVGAAAIFEFMDGEVEILRLNKKYLAELGMNLSEKELIEMNPLSWFDEENAGIYFETLKRAIESGKEEECETWRTFSSFCCGEERICIRSNVHMIGRNGDRYMFYAMIRNITTEKEYYEEVHNSEKLFKMASEQAKIYYWEYNVATREMRPCFRCMRDFGFPSLLQNYPEPAIEAGVFPPEVADTFRDWHRQIEKGVPELEAVFSLTEARLPFRVRYTTEFDESGKPVKAYGSAIKIV